MSETFVSLFLLRTRASSLFGADVRALTTHPDPLLTLIALNSPGAIAALELVLWFVGRFYLDAFDHGNPLLRFVNLAKP